jgi:hypothetical protein
LLFGTLRIVAHDRWAQCPPYDRWVVPTSLQKRRWRAALQDLADV